MAHHARVRYSTYPRSHAGRPARRGMLGAEVCMAERNGGTRVRWAGRAATLTMTALALAVVAVVGVLLAGPAHRLGLLAARWALGLFALAAIVGLVAAILAALGLGFAIAAGAWRSVAGSAVALLRGPPPAAPPLVLGRPGPAGTATPPPPTRPGHP